MTKTEKLEHHEKCAKKLFDICSLFHKVIIDKNENMRLDKAPMSERTESFTVLYIFGSKDKQIGFIQIFTKDEETKVKIIINAYEENYRVKVIDNYSMKTDCNDLETLEMISNFLVLSLEDRLKDEKEHKRRERESLLKDL